MRKREPKISKSSDWWMEGEGSSAQLKTQECKSRAPLPLMCACGGDQHGHCIPSHPHHVGNVLADTLAEKGKGLECAHCKVRMLQDKRITNVQDGMDEELLCYSGEDAIALVVNGNIHQGSISRALAVAVGARRLHQLQHGELVRGQQWKTAAKECSYIPARKSAMEADTSRRFKVRAWADCLPTYQNISRRSRGEIGRAHV